MGYSGFSSGVEGKKFDLTFRLFRINGDKYDNLQGLWIEDEIRNWYFETSFEFWFTGDERLLHYFESWEIEVIFDFVELYDL